MDSDAAPTAFERTTVPLAAPRDIDTTLEIADLLGQTIRRLHRGTNKALAPLGLSRAKAHVLHLLADGPLRMVTISERLAVVPRTVTDLVDGVETAGLVTRRHDPDDRRSTLVALTPDGRRLLQRMEAARRASAELVLGRLDAADQALLLRVLREVVARPAPPCDGGDEGTAAAGTAVVGDGSAR
jgi:DNA-binding MarR family transcriptional regulator